MVLPWGPDSSTQVPFFSGFRADFWGVRFGLCPEIPFGAPDWGIREISEAPFQTKVRPNLGGIWTNLRLCMPFKPPKQGT